MYTRTFVLACIGLLGLIGMPGAGTAQEAMVPQLINYQGTLTGPDGKPPVTGDYTLSFSIYDSPMGQSTCTPAQRQYPTLYTCGTRVWGPQVFDGKTGRGHGAQVPVVKGFFNVILGPHDTDGDPIGQAFASPNLFLEVTVEDDAPVLPRQQLLSAPFALTSMGDVPVGGITMFFGKEEDLPGNWRICDGRSVDDPDSPLHELSLPDLRNKFVRGANSDSRVGDTGGRDRRAKHKHRVSVRAHISRDSIRGWWRRPLLCVDRNKHDESTCDTTGMVFPISNMAIDQDPDYWALVIPRGNTDESHGHDVKIKTRRVSSDRDTDLDNRPAHVNLHYIIRIK